MITPLPTPFLRWVGGKRHIATTLLGFLPDDAPDRRYVEPFVGAGSLFFALRPTQAMLCDLNPHLMECYRFVRDDYMRVAAYLARLAGGHSKEQYYRVRTKFNSSGSSAAQAARFIYLNQTCFNGIYRVNRAGEFNVPWGNKPRPNFPKRAHLWEVSNVLRGVDLVTSDYRQLTDGHI